MNCLILHGCPSGNTDPSYKKHWIQWAKQELLKRWIPTETPLLPAPWAPDYEAFKEEFEKYSINESTILIGHSCGCAFLVRWLWETQTKIASLILVAPWKIPDEWDVWRERFYNYEIDPSVATLAHEIIYFTSDNEEDDGRLSLKMFHNVLGGIIISLDNHGHYTLWEMWTEKFPELITYILNS